MKNDIMKYYNIITKWNGMKEFVFHADKLVLRYWKLT